MEHGTELFPQKTEFAAHRLQLVLLLLLLLRTENINAQETNFNIVLLPSKFILPQYCEFLGFNSDVSTYEESLTCVAYLQIPLLGRHNVRT